MTRAPRTRRGTPTRATLREVASLARVSVMTVSNVINGKFGSMTPSTRARVERAITRLNYRPHAVARSLRADLRHAIGMIVVDRSPTYLADPWITQLVAGLSNYLSSRNYGLLLQGLAPEAFHDSILVRHLLTDGTCVLLSGPSRSRRRIIQRLRGLGQPVVLFQEVPAPRGTDICVLRQDDRRGGELLGRHLLSRGLRRFVMLSTRWEWPALRERERGVRAALAADGAAALDLVECEGESFEATTAGLAGYLDAHELPDAVITGNDQMGIAAVKLLRARGVRVPGRVAVTGFNAFDFRQYSDPVLTTVRSPAYELGALGGEVMLRRLAEGRFSRARIVLPIELEIGGSA